MKVLSFLLLACFVASALSSSNPDYDQFTAFIAKYNKVYQTDLEFDLRFGIFKNNLKKIERLNANPELDGEQVYGVTKFADLTIDEVSRYTCGGKLTGRFPNRQFPAVPQMPATHIYDVSALPASFDWTEKGAVTPVKDQGQCGSCWAFSTIGNIEGAWFLAKKNLTSLAESQLVDCGTTSYGCSGGWPFWALEDLMKDQNGKVDTEASYPYAPQNAKCAFADGVVGATIRNWTNYCHENTDSCTEEQIMTLLVHRGPLSVCLNANGMISYQSGIDQPSPDDCSFSSIDHCITLVGYGADSNSGKKYWKLKNSWGTGWGEKGYYRLIRGVSTDQPHGRCGINTVITAVHI